MDETDPFSVEGRLAHHTAVTELSDDLHGSPAALNGAVIEFLDTVYAWICLFNPCDIDPGIGFLGEERPAPFDAVRSQSRQRLQLLCDSLTLVIQSDELTKQLDTTPLMKVLEVSWRFDCNPDGERGEYDASCELTRQYWRSKRLLDELQSLHALKCRQKSQESHVGEVPRDSVGDSKDVPSSSKRTKSLSRKHTVESVNEEMKVALGNDPDLAVRYSLNDWMEHIGCGKGTVQKTEMWKHLNKQRRLRGLDRRGGSTSRDAGGTAA